jgi:hypothetical protein
MASPQSKIIQLEEVKTEIENSVFLEKYKLLPAVDS